MDRYGRERFCRHTEVLGEPSFLDGHRIFLGAFTGCGEILWSQEMCAGPRVHSVSHTPQQVEHRADLTNVGVVPLLPTNAAGSDYPYDGHSDRKEDENVSEHCGDIHARVRSASSSTGARACHQVVTNP
jgi:hypothetical protein